MNRRFPDAILEAADNSIISGLVVRLHHVPFVSPETIAFDKKSADEMYDLLFHAHRQHHAITEALENNEGARVESLLKEHVYSQKQSMNLIGHRPGMQPSTLSGHPAQARFSEKSAIAKS